MSSQQGQEGNSAQAQKVVGPNIQGRREEYRLERRLQNGLFGGVYEARGLSSGRSFAVKVLHQSEILKCEQADKLEFCEVPLSEIKFLNLMSGCNHVMQVEDHFEDQYCHYIVFELCSGGDLLEALKLRPTGFEEHQAQFLINQAARGLSVLHERKLAMQDVSLENMLIKILEDGQYQIKICDPGQAILFESDSKSGEELPVDFKGFVGKSFRPPEFYTKRPYLASKVDAWCLGWSTFYLLAAQPLFLSADPNHQDADWALFRNGEVAELFRQKGASCSRKCMDFIMRLMQLDPCRRLSIADALQHDWLADASIRPMYATPRGAKTSEAEKPTIEVIQKASIPSPSKVKSAHSPTAGNTGVAGGPSSQFGQSATVQASSNRNSNGLSPDANRSGRFRNPQPVVRAVQPAHLAQITANPSIRAASRGQAPAWKMAPTSRSESPSPCQAGSGIPLRAPQPQAARNASPLGAATSSLGTSPARDENLARQCQLGTPRRPDPSVLRAVGSIRNGPGTSGKRRPSLVELGEQQRTGSNSLLQSSPLHHSDPAVGLASSTAARSVQYSAPQQTLPVNNSDGANSPTGNSPKGYSGATPTTTLAHTSSGGSPSGVSSGGGVDSQGPSAVTLAVRATSGASGRQQQLGGSIGDSGHGGTSGLQSAGGTSSGGVSANIAAATHGGHRSSSPIPQSNLIMRPGQTGRGYSPGPTAAALAQTQPQRAGSPLQPHTPAAMSGVISGGGHFWQSPRTSSPGSNVIRPNEAFARGRSTTRASSPSQVATVHSPVPVHAYNNSVVRPVSPNVVANVPTRAAGGFAWSPAPLSPAPNKRAVHAFAWSPAPPSPPPDKRTVSPVPNANPNVVLSGSPVPRWVA